MKRIAVAATLALALTAGTVASAAAAGAPRGKGLEKLQHLIFIIQENRSFDSYFGTYPGADGFPYPPPCLPSERHPSQCETPYPNHEASNEGGPYLNEYQEADIDGGKMDGFVIQREEQLKREGCPYDPEFGEVEPDCKPGGPGDIVDVMGYHDGTDLPNYWAYAQNFVLQDHFHEAIHSWSQPGHMYLFSGWSAKCPKGTIASCASAFGGDFWGTKDPTPYLWTDITYLLYQNNVTWTAYLDGGQGATFTHHGVQGIWNVLPGFETVQDDGQLGNALVNLTQFYSDAAAGTLPAVSWILPQQDDSEHPTSSVAHGETYVTGLINAAMSGPEWSSTAVFLTYDDDGGFYDHEPPPFNFDKLGLGIRVPALIVSPYAKQGYIDHQICSTDCYLKFIEDVFLNGERMSQAGRPDPRPDYRDEESAYGTLANDFDFDREPRAPLLLPLHPMSLLRERPARSQPVTARGVRR
jgi:phospholipase C